MSAIKIFDKFPHVLIILLVCSRIIPHPPNFTPLIATAVICGVFYKNTFLTIFILIFSMFVSDIFLGFHSYMFFVYFSIILIYLILLSIKNFKSSYRNILFSCFMSSILFYIITNFAVWINSGFYEKSFIGLIECYTLAIPFFANTLVSTCIYASIFFLIIKNLNNNKYLKLSNA